jgi:Ca2+-transporting ATPase
MNEPPRKKQTWLFTNKEFLLSITQGLFITAGVLLLYYHFMVEGQPSKIRSIVFTTLVLSNIFLTFANRSSNETFFTTIRYKNNLALPVFIVSVLFLAIIHVVPPVRDLFRMSVISFYEFALCLVTAFASVVWFELYKRYSRKSIGLPRGDEEQALA